MQNAPHTWHRLMPHATLYCAAGLDESKHGGNAYQTSAKTSSASNKTITATATV